jgi:hypothetical protein
MCHNCRIYTIKNAALMADEGLLYCSIAMSVNPCCFADLSDDEVRRSLSFLWYTDLGRLRTVCKRFEFVVNSDSQDSTQLQRVLVRRSFI